MSAACPCAYTPGCHVSLGTDTRGRDVLSRMIYGTRVSLIVGFLAVAIGTLAGTLIGLMSGYWGAALTRPCSASWIRLWPFPALSWRWRSCLFGQSLLNVILVIGLVIAPGASRAVRSTVLSIKHTTYVDAARGRRLVLAHCAATYFAQCLCAYTHYCLCLAGECHRYRSRLELPGFWHPTTDPNLGWYAERRGRRSLETVPYLAIFLTGH